MHSILRTAVGMLGWWLCHNIFLRFFLLELFLLKWSAQPSLRTILVFIFLYSITSNSNRSRVMLVLQYVHSVFCVYICNTRLILFYRLRCICMVFVFAAGAIIWQNRQFLSSYTSSVLPLSESETWRWDIAVLLSVTGVLWLVTSSHLH